MAVTEGAGRANTRNTTTTVRKPTPFTGGPSPRAMDQHQQSSGDRWVPVNNFTAQDAQNNMNVQRMINGIGSTGGAWDTSGGGGGGGYGSWGGGGGGGGVPQIDQDAIMNLMNRTPQQFAPGQQYQWQAQQYNPYEGTGFYEFDGAQYDRMGRGITEGLAADRAAGAAAYGDARTELADYQNPFANRQYTQNQPMDAAMQRMMAANGVGADQATQAQGAQADQAFGNVLALLGGNADQYQAAQMRALSGDERRLGESLDSQGRSMQMNVDMQRAKALEKYNQDKWMYGEEIARSNYERQMEVDRYNNQGQNQVGQANTAMTNQTAQQNTQLANDYNSGNVQALLDLLASGQKIDPALFKEWAPTAAPAAGSAA